MKGYTLKGYTLIEILVVLSIAAFLFIVGYAGFRDFSRRQALTGAVKEIQGDLSLAQGYALAGQKPDDISCNSPQSLIGYNFRIFSTSEYRIEAVCTGGQVIREAIILDASSGISITAPSPNPISFKVLGSGTNIPSSSTAVITLTQAGTGATATITVGPGGEIR